MKIKYEVKREGKNIIVKGDTGERTFSRVCLSGEWAGIDEKKEIRRMKREIRKEANEY